jgi:hypothetical protein
MKDLLPPPALSECGHRNLPLVCGCAMGVFDPEDIAVMATAFDRLLADFKLVDLLSF